LAVLAWARRQNQQTQSSFGRLFAVGVSSEEPALAPLNQQALSQDPNAGFYQGISMAYRPIDGPMSTFATRPRTRPAPTSFVSARPTSSATTVCASPTSTRA
jgi:hypothetical protein